MRYLRLGASELRRLGASFFQAPTHRGPEARRCRGQATTEMVLIIPLMVAVIGGGMVLVYTCWQGIKVQQSANLAARIQGEERVAGGLDKASIQNTNGVGVDMSTSNGDDDPTLTKQDHYRQGSPDANTVYGKLRTAVRNMFGSGAENGVYVPPPLIGQNIDKVKVVRVINIGKIPFMDNSGGPKQIKIEGTAWGGEDTYMYGLPRWGRTANSSGSSNDLEWRRMVGDNTSQHD